MGGNGWPRPAWCRIGRGIGGSGWPGAALVVEWVGVAGPVLHWSVYSYRWEWLFQYCIGGGVQDLGCLTGSVEGAQGGSVFVGSYCVWLS